MGRSGPGPGRALDLRRGGEAHAARYGAIVLLRDDGDAVIAIGQASHSWISGQLAGEWGNDAFAAPAPRDAVRLAAGQHDVGMAEWDLRPSLNSRTGRPHSFLEMPLALHIALWTAAPAKLMTQSRYAALLVSMHGTALYEARHVHALDQPERRLVAAYLEGERARQRALAERLGAAGDELRRNQRLLWTWDGLSLALCLRWAPYSIGGVPAGDGAATLSLTEVGESRFTLAPWPFRSAGVVVRCEGVRLEGRYETEAALHEALGAAPIVGLRFELAPSAEG